jgi:DNA replication protein DnaC
MVDRRIKEARFSAVKSVDSFDFVAIPSLNKTLVLELARSEDATGRENVIAVGNSGTGKTYIALGIGLAACQKGLSVGFYTARPLFMNCWTLAMRSGCFVCSGRWPDTRS